MENPVDPEVFVSIKAIYVYLLLLLQVVDEICALDIGVHFSLTALFDQKVNKYL